MQTTAAIYLGLAVAAAAACSKPAPQAPQAPHEATAIAGTWTGTVEVIQRENVDRTGNSDAADGESKHTQVWTVTITQHDGKTFVAHPGAANAEPVVLTVEGDKLVDRNQPDIGVDTYTFTGGQLTVDSEDKGRGGGTSHGVLHRAP